MPFNFFPQLEGDIVTAQARLPYGVPVEQTEEVRDELAAALADNIEEFGGEVHVKGVFTRIGEEAPTRGPGAKEPEKGSHIVAIEVNLVPSDERSFKAEQFANAWQDKLPEIPGLESLSFSAESGPGAGDAVAVQLLHRDTETLAAASREVDERLRSYDGLKNIRNDYTSGKTQFDFHLRDRRVRWV